jgi:hypothetical protein
MLLVCVGLVCWTCISVLVDSLKMEVQCQNMWNLILTMNCILMYFIECICWLIYRMYLFLYSIILFNHSLFIPYDRSKKVSVTCQIPD